MPKTRSNNSQVITFDSEAELQFALNQATLPDRWNVLAKGGKFTAVGTGGGQFISPEAEEVLANMPTPLAGAERDAVINFLNSQSVSLGSGNWSFVDAFAHAKLTDLINKLWKWKQNDAMINNGAVLGDDGWDFNGIDQYIDANWIPSVDGINYQITDAMIGVYLLENRVITVGGVFGAVTANGVNISDDKDNDRVTFFSNNINGTIFAGGSLISNALYLQLIDELRGTYYENGSLFRAGNQVPEGLEAVSIYIGAENRNPATGFFDGKVSSFVAGGRGAFDQLDFYNNLAILNNAL